MFKRLLFAVMCAGIILGIGYTQQSTVTIPAGKTSATDGKQMFVSYCAPCHGTDGRGRGPVASSLVLKPADLTLIAENNHGKYPSAHVVAVIQFGSQVEAHGTKDMPVWGPILGSIDRLDMTRSVEVRTLRVGNLTRYIESIQAK